MAKIPDRLTPDPELRLLALYALSRLGPCTDLTLLQFLFEYDLMNYFELMASLTDLCKQGNAVRTEEEAAWRYEITDAGREVLNLFENRIPGSKRETVDAHTEEWLPKIERERERGAVVRQTERGEYAAELTLRDGDMELMRVTLSLPTGEMAQRIADGWRERASGVYQTIIGLLKGADE